MCRGVGWCARVEVFFAVAATAALFVALAYWGLVCVDPLFMFPVDQIFPKDRDGDPREPASEAHRALLDTAVWQRWGWRDRFGPASLTPHRGVAWHPSS